jgi:hypothetical protein
MENKILKHMEESGFAPKIVAILQGGSVGNDLTPGELLCLSMHMPPQRIGELLSFDAMPFFGLCQMLSKIENNPDYEKLLLEKMKKKAVTFEEKFEVIFGKERENNPEAHNEFLEILEKASQVVHCLLLAGVADNQDEVDAVIFQMKKFNPSIDDWGEIAENVSTLEVITAALEQMEIIAKKSNNVRDWLKVYDYCIAGSLQEKHAIQKIDECKLSFQAWFDIYKNDDWNWNDNRVGQLALKNMQILKGTFAHWKQLFDNAEYPIKGYRDVYFQMMWETSPTLKECWILYDDCSEMPTLQMSILKKMMAIADGGAS